MSFIYFHTPTDSAELIRAEREWLRHLAIKPGRQAWALDDETESGFERARMIMDMVPEQPNTRYLHKMAADSRRELPSALISAIEAGNVPLLANGVELNALDVTFNTALANGSDTIRLAAKIYAWCEAHAWAEGRDRAWLADLIDRAVRDGIYRDGLWVTSTHTGQRVWAETGWQQVIYLLRARDDEPVVLEFSGTDSFPNRRLVEASGTAWAGLDEHQKWELAMEGLRRARPWARLAPDTLATQTFGPPVTVYDLLAA